MSVFTSISSCTSGNSNDSQKDYSSDDLNSNITKFYIGWTKLSKLKNNYPTLQFFADALSQVLVPSFMGGGRYFHHLFGWILIENGNSFIVEYDRKGYYIRKCSFDEFEKMCDTHFYFNGVDVSPPIQLTFENMKTLGDLVKKCDDFLKSSDYKLLGHSCQDFINIFIKETKAKRLKNDKGRGNHSAGVFGIPYVILKELEKNEDDGTNVIGYIPVLGTFIDSFRG